MGIKPKVFKKLTKALAKKVIAGNFEVSIADSLKDIQASQALRYRVLFAEGEGIVTPEMEACGREEDQWDEHAYHVIVKDKKQQKIVGSMRLVSSNKLPPSMKTYTEQYFDLIGLRDKFENPLELSRACVSSGKRDGVVLLLIWKFVMQFINDNGFDVMFGCASFASTDYQKHGPIMSYLNEHNLAPQELMPKPIVEHHVNVADIKFDKDFEDNKKLFGKRLKVPTMLRGYLKLGAKVSDTAIIDYDFNTTFLCIYVDAAEMRAAQHVLVKQ